MAEPEHSSQSEPQLSRAEKEALLQKIYTLPHWIAVIRAFAYKTLSMETARKDIKLIAEEFGKEKTADACEALVEILPGNEPVARLKSHIKRMAFQILGPEKHEPAPPTAPPAPMKRAKTASEPAEKPVKQPRHFVLKRCEAWLNESKLTFVPIDDVKRTTPAVSAHVGSVDFVVLRNEEKLLVTVRPNVQKKHLVALAELQKLFGSEYRAVRIWPADGADGWVWQEHAIEPTGASA